MKLGKQPARHDPRTLRLAKYLLPSRLPPLPPASDYTTGIKDWPMLMNDNLGCCVPAGILHGIETMTANSSTIHVPSDAEVLAAYEAIGGYKPSDPATDQGCDMLSAMNYWKSSGVAGHQIDAFAKINITDLDELKMAVHLFGCALIGVMLPRTAEKETDDGNTWQALSETPDPNRGHCVVIVSYEPDYFTVVTWGLLQAVTPAWLAKYMDEAYAPFSIGDWGKNSPVAIDIAALQIDLAAIAA